MPIIAPDSADTASLALLSTIRTIQSRPPIGCPWTHERTPRDFIAFTRSELEEIEEALECLDRSQSSSESAKSYFRRELTDELGDLLWDAVKLVGLCARDHGISEAAPWRAAAVVAAVG